MPLQEEEMESTSNNLTVVDVYDLAASIGKEFESIIDNYGPEAVTDLMPKVIASLEHLEILSNNNQKENAEINELKHTIERLQAEKAAKATEREKYEQELEQIEEAWRKETSELMETVGKLTEDNRKLKSALTEREGHSAKVQSQMEEEEKAEITLATKLREQCNKQRDSMRSLQRELQQRNVDLEAMQSQLERLAKLNADYRRKTTLTQRQAQNLIKEKAELQAQLHGKEQQITLIRAGMHEQESFDKETGGPASPSSPTKTEEFTNIEQRLQLEGKMVIDLTDPDRPRFTLNELREVLQERNELKTKLIEVEEELTFYKPESHEDDIDPDLPVQGPINREPDEKLHPEKYGESGIRKFFSFIFKGKSEKDRKLSPRGGTMTKKS